MRKGKIQLQFENLEIYKRLQSIQKPLNRDWLARVVFPIQTLLT